LAIGYACSADIDFECEKLDDEAFYAVLGKVANIALEEGDEIVS